MSFDEKSASGWGLIELNDGRKIPEIGWGSWTAGSGQTVVDQVYQAIDTGFDHIDTAQTYRNEAEVGQGIKEAALSRKDLWVTTKWTKVDGKGIDQSVHESLEKLKLKSLDLYLIHHPRLVTDDPIGAWKKFELLKKQGLTKSIGVSNYQISDLETIKNAGLTTPAVNQILLHPYVYEKTKALLQYHADNGIVTEAYSTLYPLTHETGGPLDGPLNAIAGAHQATQAAVLFAWARSKGAVIVTTSRQKERLEDYLHAGSLKLTDDEIKQIDDAGAAFRLTQKTKKATSAAVTVLTSLAVAAYWWKRLAA
ncbi:NADP-dependent oxidoreductase domain-containing protein [Pseudohyphozyma bogoriensis]|nr:NADP-dependent oxidoreductase domain-containing protein [Pseudohyphozyma bogoriensis]